MPDVAGEAPGVVVVPDNDLTLPGPGYMAPGGLTFRVVDGTTGMVVQPETFWRALIVPRFVCVGEVHDDYFSHSLGCTPSSRWL